MQALLEVAGLYAATSLASGLLYSVHTGGRLTKSTLAFALLYPATWTGLSVATAIAGVYYQLLPNSSLSLGIAACLSLFPAALIAHSGA